jgi:hypothetical protein
MGFFLLLGAFYFLVMPILLFALWGRVKELERRLEGGTQPSQARTVEAKATEEKPVVKKATSPSTTALPARSLEEHLTKNWFQWLGIAALLIGLVFFLKWAFDNNMIGPSTLTVVGYLLCAAAIAAGMWLYKMYGQWGLTFCGGGVLGSYVVTWLALHQFAIFSAWLGFAMYIIGAAIACALAMHYRNQPIAAFGIIGGFLTPLLVDVNTATAIVLTYILFLNLAIFAMSWLRGWKWMSVCGLFGTILYEIVAYADRVNDGFSSTHGLLFVAVFTVVYLLVAMFFGVLKKDQMNQEQATLTLVNAIVHFGLALFWVDVISGNPAMRAMTALVFAAFFGVLAIATYMRNNSDNVGVVTTLGLMVFFIAFSAPLQFGGAWVPFAWTILATFLVGASVSLNDKRIQPLAWWVIAAAMLWYFFPGLSCIFDRWLNVSCSETGLFRTNWGFFLFCFWMPLLVLLAAFGIGAKMEDRRMFTRAALIAMGALCLGFFAQWPGSFEMTVYLDRSQRLIEVLAILIGGVVIHSIAKARNAQLTENDRQLFAGMLVALHIVGLWYLTQEYILALRDGYLPFLGAKAQVEQVGVSVLWALFGAVTLAVGVMKNHKAQRYFGIALLLEPGNRRAHCRLHLPRHCARCGLAVLPEAEVGPSTPDEAPSTSLHHTSASSISSHRREQADRAYYREQLLRRVTTVSCVASSS